MECYNTPRLHPSIPIHPHLLPDCVDPTPIRAGAVARPPLPTYLPSLRTSQKWSLGMALRLRLVPTLVGLLLLVSGGSGEHSLVTQAAPFPAPVGPDTPAPFFDASG